MMGAILTMASQVAVVRTSDELPPLDPAVVGSGHVIYEQHCATCHGADAQGAPNWQQRDAQGELPAPPHNAEGHTWRHSDAELFAMVSNGWRDPFNKTKRLTMPAFEGVLSPEQIRAVLTYLKTLWTPEERQFQVEESRNQAFPHQMQ
jgi:mono/diheme cytochrome c family protein